MARALLGHSVGSLAHAGSIRAWCVKDSDVFCKLGDHAVCAGEGNMEKSRRVFGIAKSWGRSDGRATSGAVLPGAKGESGGQGDGGRCGGRTDRVVDSADSGIERVIDDCHSLSICHRSQKSC